MGSIKDVTDLLIEASDRKINAEMTPIFLQVSAMLLDLQPKYLGLEKDIEIANLKIADLTELLRKREDENQKLQEQLLALTIENERLNYEKHTKVEDLSVDEIKTLEQIVERVVTDPDEVRDLFSMVSEADTCLDKLVDLGFIEFDRSGNYVEGTPKGRKFIKLFYSSRVDVH
jgi:hypothetical protein